MSVKQAVPGAEGGLAPWQAWPMGAWMPRVLSLALALSLVSGMATAAVDMDDFGGLAAVSDGELAELRGGFAFGPFQLDVGILVRTVVDRALDGQLAERLEILSSFAIPEPGRLAHLGTTTEVEMPGVLITHAGHGETDGSTGPASPTPSQALAPAINDALTLKGGDMRTAVNLGGATNVVHQMLNTIVQNSGTDRTLVHSVDLNLHIGNFGRVMTFAGAQRAANRVVTEVNQFHMR